MSRVLAGALSLVVGLVGCRRNEVTTPALSLTCAAQPAAGVAPLAVRFLVSVAGAEGPFRVAVSYGDGLSGADADLPHTYLVAGSYTASFTVDTATQSARCAALVVVSAGPSPTPSPSPLANQPPHAIFKSTPAAAADGTIRGTAPLAVRFNMCASSDPDGDPLWFLIDFDGDGRWDSAGGTGADCRHDFSYPAGTYNARNCLYDMGPSGERLHPNQCRTFTVIATP